MTLAEFIAARLGGDEVAAGAALKATAEPWQDTEWEDQPEAYLAHYDRHGPARVLREVAAKRAILAEHRPIPMRGIVAESCVLCRLPYPCPQVRHIAAVWSDHEAYDPGWKP